MSKNETRLWMSDTVYAKIINIKNGNAWMWVMASVLSFYLNDWTISWGQVVTFISGFFFGYLCSMSWVRDRAGRMNLDQ